ncbi:MAG TPA: bifunctional glutamate N-acetyltransferase/amino-acid acetyltransferase ArgJ [Acidimicrobiales bacterium]|nr:bifunctional glutamate N-acetyltransferase/amino-acid acetyltransferase ArgJ [Acidimicrobiales bacterium]
MSVTWPRGFVASGMAAGVKPDGIADLALVAAVTGAVPAAATFTTNKACAAPVIVSRKHLAATKGRAAAVVLNSGCANAATGRSGQLAAERMAAAVAGPLGVGANEILVCSTGLIGPALPIGVIEAAAPALVGRRGPSADDAKAAATAILTTDTHPKQVRRAGRNFRVGGMAKGAGMIAPQMATMLAVLTTDAGVSPALLRSVLHGAVDRTFNALLVDGCTSTNDTVVALASGEAGEVGAAELATTLAEACADLASQLAADAEGATRVARVVVAGAVDDEDARHAARAVAGSLLVKVSLYGADPYWGRIVSELGASGVAFDPDRVRVAYGATTVVAGGVAVEHDWAAAAEHLAGTHVEISCDLGLGDGVASVLATDLGPGYIEENRRTS